MIVYSNYPRKKSSLFLVVHTCIVISVYSCIFFSASIAHVCAQEFFISLGFRCDCAQNMIRNNVRKCSLPFDWIFSPDFERVTTLIEHKFDGFFSLDTIYAVDDPGNILHTSVHNNKYLLQFVHDLPKGVSLQEAYPSLAEKYRRRISRFFMLLKTGRKIIFLRRRISKKEAATFVAMMQRNYPALDFTLVAINGSSEHDSIWKIPHVDLYICPETFIPGRGSEISKADWDAIFNRYRRPL